MEPDANRAPTRVYAGRVWCAGVGGRSVGPLTMQGLAARSQLRRSTLVWRDGFPAWIPAEAIADIRALPGLPEAPPPGDPPALPNGPLP